MFDRQQEDDIHMVLSALEEFARPQAVEQWAVDSGNTEEELDRFVAAVKEL